MPLSPWGCFPAQLVVQLPVSAQRAASSKLIWASEGNIQIHD
jgi:hypothetical protein